MSERTSTPPESSQGASKEGAPEGRESHWQRLLALDRALLLRVRRWEVRQVTWLMRGWTRLGDPNLSFLVPLLLWLTCDEGLRYALLCILAATLGVGVSQFLKRTVRRARPSDEIAGFVALMEQPDVFSFPSGHACAAFAAAFALAGEGMLLVTVLVIVASGVALSRLYLGLHYPLDVAAGIGLGSAVGLAVHGALA